jgi:exosome complex exonuclease RRP6
LSEAAEEQAKSAADAAPQAMEIDEPAKVEEEVDEEFTLKRGQKRKADEDNDFIAFDGDVLNTPRAEEILQAHKAQKREQKKSKKHDKGKTAASEAGKEAVVEEEGDEEDEQADEEEVEDAQAANKTISRKAAKRARKERNRQKRAAREAEEGAEDQASPETDDAGGGMAEEEGGDAVAEEFISLDLDLDSEAERRRTKREARQQRKQAKAAAKAAAAEGDGGGKEDDEEAFDYATAASVLRAPRGGDDGQGRGGRRVRNFNPYAKADTHAIRGARKAPPVAGARSAVFKK